MNSTSKLASLFFGTSNNPRARAGLHVVFWAVAFGWFWQQANWMVGEVYPQVTALVALGKMGFAMAFFYLASAFLSSNISLPVKIGAFVLLLVGSYVAYGLLMYGTYNYLSAHYLEVPAYVKALAKSVSAKGRWTFMQEVNVLYFHFQQLLMGLLLPLIIKGTRFVFQSRFRSMALEQDNLKLELDFLRSQINPHFLFNTLNSVYALVEDKDQTAASVIHSLSNIMRFALYDTNIAQVEVEKELETIRHYLDIQEVRHSRRLTIFWEISPELGRQPVPPLLLLTFVENAIKHGVDKYINPSRVTIKAYRDAAETFCFEVINSVPTQKSIVAQEGIGIKNTRRRLDLLYPGKHALEIRQTEEEHNLLLKIW